MHHQCKNSPVTALEWPRGFQEVKALRFHDNDTGRWQGCQPYAPAAFTPRKYTWYSFLLEAESTPGPCIINVKAVPLQAWSGPEGSRKLRFPDFMTTAQEGGKVVSLTHRPPLPPGNTPGTHFC